MNRVPYPLGSAALSSMSIIPQANPLAAFAEHKSAIEAACCQVRLRLLHSRHTGPSIRAGVCRLFGRRGGHWRRQWHRRTRVGIAQPGCRAWRRSSQYHTAVATVAAIERCGANAVLVDIDPERFTMSAGALDEALNNRALWKQCRPKAVVVVHLYGQPAEMKPILSLARSHGLLILEDAAQSHGARLDGQMTGSLADAAAFSFYPTKNLGAFGDGGAIATNDLRVAARARSLREYGWGERYISRRE